MRPGQVLVSTEGESDETDACRTGRRRRPAGRVHEPAPPSTGDYTDVTAAEANDLIDTTPALVIIDVSPISAQGHIPGAINYYVGDGSLDAAIPTLNPNAPYLVYCHTDPASIQGAQKLVDER